MQITRFNPRPREGATSGNYTFTLEDQVSIRAPVRGRRVRKADREAHQCFNPRPREGATAARAALARDYPVSIRAPVRGRRRKVTSRIGRSRFQSAPP